MEKRPAEMAHFLTSDGANVNSIFMEFDVNDVLTESIKIQKIFDLVWIHHEKENPLLFGLNSPPPFFDSWRNIFNFWGFFILKKLTPALQMQ